MLDSELLRRRIAMQCSMNSLEPFELLLAVGRYCVGAVQLLDENETPQGVDSIAGKVLSALLGKNRHYDMHRIARRHFNSAARQLGFGTDMDELIDDIRLRYASRVHAARFA